MHEFTDFTLVTPWFGEKIARSSATAADFTAALFHCMYPNCEIRSNYSIRYIAFKSAAEAEAAVKCRWMSVMCKCDFYHLIHSSFMPFFANFRLNALLIFSSVSPFWCVFKTDDNTGVWMVCACVFDALQGLFIIVAFFLLFFLPSLLSLIDNSFSSNFHTNNI